MSRQIKGLSRIATQEMIQGPRQSTGGDETPQGNRGIIMTKHTKGQGHCNDPHGHAREMHDSMNEVADLAVGIIKVGAVTQIGMGFLGAMNPKP